MTLREELIKYCKDCINDKIISCKKHKQACKRLLHDFENENTNDFEYIWNEQEAQKIVKWFSYLRHSKGVLAGKPIILTTWQKFIVCQIYGWIKADGNRRFTKAFIEVGRKNAKSQLLSGVLLYEISCTSVKYNELFETYTAGIKKDQSKIIFNECKLMLRGSPLITKFKINRDMIEHIKSGSFIKPLSKEEGKKGDGTNPACTCLDEYHLHETSDFYDMHDTGAKARRNPLLLIITTAGFNLSSPCYTQEYTYCSNILAKINNNDRYFIDILEIDDADEITIENISKANPIVCSYKEGVEGILESLKIANDVPEKMTAFLTKTCNMWLNKSKNGYMDMDKFKACVVDKIPFNLSNKDVYIGIDVSSKTDLCAVSFEFPLFLDNVLKFAIKTHSFIPSYEKLKEHIQVDKMPYDTWVRNGLITITNTPIVDQKQVIDYCINTCKENGWNIKAFCVDPHNASLLITTLTDMGYDVYEIYQSKKHLNEPTVDLREQIYCKNIFIENNPCLTWQFNNAKLEISADGLIKIDKSKQRERIDNVDSTICAHKLAMYYKEEVDLNKKILADDFYM